MYANTAYSFRPYNGIDANGNAFAPEKGHGYEVGVKWAGAHSLTTLAAFDVTKRNVLTADPANSGFSRAAGEVRSRGLEFEWNGELGGGFRGIANLAYIDAEVTHDTVLAPGARLVDIPRVSGSALLMYEFAPPFAQKGGRGRRRGLRRQPRGQHRQHARRLPTAAYTTVQINGYVQLDKHRRARWCSTTCSTAQPTSARTTAYG